MNLREEILREHSKQQAELIAAWVGKNSQRFSKLVEHVISGEETISQRAAYAFSHTVEGRPDLVKPHLQKLVEVLDRADFHCAVRRSVAKILKVVEIPEDLEARVFDACFARLIDPAETVAVRVYSMTTLARICENYPDLIPEVTVAIESNVKGSQAAFKARARMTLSKLEKLVLFHAKNPR